MAALAASVIPNQLVGFQYKTCAFSWVKADNTQPHFFQDDLKPEMKLGYWTRANSEVCLLATRGNPKRLNADVRQAIIAPSRAARMARMGK
jgi:N6-adenosine-specific RNA methylase IME4